MATAVLEVAPLSNETDGAIKNRLRDYKIPGGARDFFLINPADVVIEDGFNPRDYTIPANREHLDNLKQSIKDNLKQSIKELGVLQPILVRMERNKTGDMVPYLVDGECRLRASLELIAEGTELDGIPARQVTGVNNEAARLLTALTANAGKPLTQWEAGRAYQRFERFGWTVEKIAQRTGKTPRYVKDAIELADSPEEVQKLLSTNAVTPSLALSAVRKNGAAAVQTLRVAAQAAQASGKPTATRAKATPTTTILEVTAKVKALARDVQDGALKNKDWGDWVDVKRVKFAELCDMLGIEY